MKTHFIRLKRTSLLMTALFLLTMTHAQKYYITFTGHGEANTVQNVTVENLTQKTSLTLPGDQTLILNLEKVGIHEINTQTAQALTIYPNPSNGTSFMQFTLLREGNVDVCLYDMAGKLHKQATLFLQEGVHTLTLPSMATGVYLLSVRSNTYSSFGKWVSIAGGQATDGNIQHASSASLTEKETTKTAKAAEADEYTMNYTQNDLLRFTGKSGNYRTIVMKRPTESQQIDFRFIACTDGCGKNYPVIEIAGIYWMAEDLSCDRKASGGLFYKATSTQAWVNNSDTKEVIAFKELGDYDIAYGTFYNYAAALASLPEGWALPTKENFEDLYAAMGREKKSDVALGLIHEDDQAALFSDIPASGYRNETGFGTKGAGYITYTGYHGSKNTGVAYWTSTDDGNGNRYTPYINKDSVQITSSRVVAGMKVRGIVAGDPLKTLQNVFGTLPIEDAKDQKPVGDICVMEDNRKKLFIAIGDNRGNNHVRVVEDITAANNSSSTTASTNLPNIPTGTWCKNKIKKAVSQRNAAGRENLVIAVLNVDASKYTDATYGNAEASTTLYIFNDSVNNYAPTTVNLTGALPVAKVNKYGPDLIAQRDFEKVNSMHWFYNVKTCDVNGDFVEDFIIVGRHKIAIYDGKAPYDLITWRDFSSDQPLATTNDAFYTCVTTGDVNQDGKDDIVVMTSAPLMNHENATQSPSVLHVFLDGNFTDTSKHKTKLITYHGRYTTNVTMGDINGDRKKEVVFNIKYLNGSTNVYSITMNANNVFSPVDTLIRSYNAGMRSFMTPINVVYFDGLMAAPYIAMGNSVFQGHGSSWQEVKIGRDSNVLTGNDVDRAVVTDQVTVSDYFGDSREHLVYLVQDYVSDKDIYAYRFGKEGSDFRLQKAIKIFHNNNEYVDPPNYFEFPTIATVRSNRVARQLQYKRHEYTYSNLQVDAVLAAAPYREGEMTPGSTYWGRSSSSGLQTESELSTSASAIFGFEQEFSIPVISQTVGGIDFTTKMSFGYTRGYSYGTTVTKSRTYTLTGANGVVVSTIPYDSYFYTILKSGDPAEVGKELMMAFPDGKIERTMSLEEYKEKTKEDPNAPRLDKVLTHTIGDPGSYKNIKDTLILSNAGKMSFCYTGGTTQQVAATGNGTSTTELGVTISEDRANSEGMSFDVDIELVVNTGGVKFGGGFGFGSSNKVTKTVGANTCAGGSVTSPPGSMEKTFVPFNWNIAFHNYISNGVIFPVVNFVVDEVKKTE